MELQMEELWKRYLDTNYIVSNTGYVRNTATGVILNPSKTRQGYVRFNLWHNGKTRSVAVHRLVAEIYLPNPDNKPIVNHKDGNPSNNRLDNLEWSTISENVKHAYATGLASVGEKCTVAKLTEADVLQIIECMNNNMSVVQVAARFNVTPSAVSHIWNGKTWKHLKRPKILSKNYKGKLKCTDIPNIRQMIAKGDSDSDIAKVYGIHSASINNIRHGKNWVNY